MASRITSTLITIIKFNSNNNNFKLQRNAGQKNNPGIAQVCLGLNTPMLKRNNTFYDSNQNTFKMKQVLMLRYNAMKSLKHYEQINGKNNHNLLTLFYQ